MICHLSAELVQRCIFSAEKKKMEREEKKIKKSWWRETDRDGGTIWSFIVLDFSHKCFFSNWLMLFLLLLTVVNSWCVGRRVWICVCCGPERARVCARLHTCDVGLFIPVFVYVCVCVSNLNAFHHSVYGPCSVRSVCKMPMLHTQQPCPIEIDWSHGGRVILGVYAVLL